MNLDQALRDAAEPVPARVGQAPAQALLDRIVNSPADPVPAPASTGRSRKILIAVAAAVAATAALTLPHLGGPGAAYASWTPRPSPLSAADRAGLGDRCVAQVRDTYHYTEPDRAARIVHGERRGDYAYLSVVTPGWSASCFRDRDGAVRDASIIVDPVSAAALGARGVELQAWPQWRTEEGYCRLMTGHVGTRVTGVDITVRNGSGDRSRTVHATVEDGYFLAWYPEGLKESSSDTTSLTLRLADGSTIGGLSARDLMDAPMHN